MLRIELSVDEVTEVVRVLEGYLADLRYEISDTDSSIYKDKLRVEKSVVMDALAKLQAVLEPAHP